MLSHRYAIAFAALLCVSCGSNSSNSPDGTVAPSGGVSNPGWSLAESKGSGISFEVPPDWKPIDFTAANASEIVDKMIAQNPGMASMGPQMKALAATGKIKLFVANTVQAATGFADNANVIVEDMPAGSNPEQLVAMAKSGIEALSKTPPEVKKVTLPAGEAYRAQASIDVALPDGRRGATYTASYMFFRDGKATTITFTSLDERKGEAEPTFNKMADTIKIK